MSIGCIFTVKICVFHSFVCYLEKNNEMLVNDACKTWNFIARSEKKVFVKDGQTVHGVVLTNTCLDF